MFIQLLYDFSRNPWQRFSKPYCSEKPRLGNNAQALFLILPPTHFLVSHVVFSFQLQLFSLKLMQFPSSSFVLHVSPIPGSVRWSTLYSVQKNHQTVSNIFFPLEKNNYLQAFVGHLLGSSLLTLTPRARLMRVWWEAC